MKTGRIRIKSQQLEKEMETVTVATDIPTICAWQSVISTSAITEKRVTGADNGYPIMLMVRVLSLSTLSTLSKEVSMWMKNL